MRQSIPILRPIDTRPLTLRISANHVYHSPQPLFLRNPHPTKHSCLTLRDVCNLESTKWKKTRSATEYARLNKETTPRPRRPTPLSTTQLTRPSHDSSSIDQQQNAQSIHSSLPITRQSHPKATHNTNTRSKRTVTSARLGRLSLQTHTSSPCAKQASPYLSA